MRIEQEQLPHRCLSETRILARRAIQRWLGLVLQLVVAGLSLTGSFGQRYTALSTAFTGASLVTLMNFRESIHGSAHVKYARRSPRHIGAVARLKSFSDN